ncbi:MAG TPA: hypothetical protein VNN62_20440 [Methylomirabilota bacterium]|nr:hypothetical protein [Methylomirabilota bacterium]
MSEKISSQLFKLEPRIRYVAVNQNGVIVEMEQSPQHPTYNPHETDRMEELIVNPIVLEIARRRGNIDMNGMRYVIIRYGTQYQLLMPYREGHISIGVELEDDPIEIARKVAEHLKLPM